VRYNDSMAERSEAPVGTVITVFRGGCEVVDGDRVRELTLPGRLRQEHALAVGDRVRFDAERGVLVDIEPRETSLERLRPAGGRRHHGGRRQVIAANMQRLAVVATASEPPFVSGVVDRFLLAAAAGGLESILVVNKLDLLEGHALPDAIRAYTAVVPVLPVSARTGAGLAELRAVLGGSRTVLAGHSGVGKSSLLNALEPELRLETGAVNARDGKGRHTTSRALWCRLPGDAIVVDTPGVREIATGPVDPALLGEVYPEIAEHAESCRFRDCQHDREPGCAVRQAVEAGALPPTRLASYRKLLAELSD
jgi:ribosome biogenesis GTPase / thiamine phosphate phosphatase